MPNEQAPQTNQCIRTAPASLRHLHPQEYRGGLEHEFNSLDAQRESDEDFIASQAGQGWVCLSDRYDDGGFTGGTWIDQR